MTGDKTSVFADDWSGEMGQRWLRNVDHFEAMLEPIGTALLDRAAIATGERIVDLGCGGGATSRAIAARVGPQGAVLGLDISPDLIVAARARAGADLPALRFFCGDAASAVLPAAPYDRLVSRFGSMFFTDPAAAYESADSEADQLEILREGMAKLDARSRDIIKRRWLDPESKVTLQELADEYGVSAERIRQIEANALKKMKALFAA